MRHTKPLPVLRQARSSSRGEGAEAEAQDDHYEGGEEKWGLAKLVDMSVLSGSTYPAVQILDFVRLFQAWTCDPRTRPTPFAPIPSSLPWQTGSAPCPCLRTIYTLPGLPSSGLDLFSRIEAFPNMVVTGRSISFAYRKKEIASARLLSDAVPIPEGSILDPACDGDDVRQHFHLLNKAAWQTYDGGYRDVRVPTQVMLRMYEAAGLNPVEATGRGVEVGAEAWTVMLDQNIMRMSGERLELIGRDDVEPAAGYAQEESG